MEGEAVGVTVAVREDLRQRIVASDKRIVFRHAPVVAQSQHFAGVAPQALRTAADRWIVGQHAYVAVADGHVQEPIRTKQHTAPEGAARSEEHTSELQSQSNLVCRLLLEKKKQPTREHTS